MDNTKSNVLIVDDEEFNLNILTEQLEDAGYTSVSAEDGERAWRLLEIDPLRFDAVLLDRMMPHMDGMEVLKRIKAHPKLKTLPVIMQTAKAANEDILEGLQAGAHYYLTKPFQKATMLAIVNTAISDYRRHRDLQQEAAQTASTLSLLDKGRFKFRSLDEAHNLATLLANACACQKNLVIGLSELMLNAVEHGNLNIGYDEKTRLIAQGTWKAEISRRLALPENAHKFVELEYRRTASDLRFTVRDQGEGFDWRNYLEISPERIFDNHGRGIAMARNLSFDSLEYPGQGNEVRAIVNLLRSPAQD